MRELSWLRAHSHSRLSRDRIDVDATVVGKHTVPVQSRKDLKTERVVEHMED